MTIHFNQVQRRHRHRPPLYNKNKTKTCCTPIPPIPPKQVKQDQEPGGGLAKNNYDNNDNANLSPLPRNDIINIIRARLWIMILVITTTQHPTLLVVVVAAAAKMDHDNNERNKQEGPEQEEQVTMDHWRILQNLQQLEPVAV